MAKLSPRLLIACAVAVPLGFITYIVLFLFAVPHLLNSRSAIPTYTGFSIQYLGLIGKVSNLHCFTNGLSANGFRYYCRFKTRPSNIKPFARDMRLESGKLVYGANKCDPSDIGLNSALDIASYPEWWKPSELEIGGQVQCYSTTSNDTIELVYSPVSQIAYLRDSDY